LRTKQNKRPSPFEGRDADTGFTPMRQSFCFFFQKEALACFAPAGRLAGWHKPLKESQNVDHVAGSNQIEQ
jgi:hypothetical protein